MGVVAQEAEQTLRFRTIEVNMEMEGTYEALKEFLVSTRKLPHLLSIKALKFDSPERGSTFKFSVTLQAYSY